MGRAWSRQPWLSLFTHPPFFFFFVRPGHGYFFKWKIIFEEISQLFSTPQFIDYMTTQESTIQWVELKNWINAQIGHLNQVWMINSRTLIISSRTGTSNHWLRSFTDNNLHFGQLKFLYGFRRLKKIAHNSYKTTLTHFWRLMLHGKDLHEHSSKYLIYRIIIIIFFKSYGFLQQHDDE